MYKRIVFILLIIIFCTSLSFIFKKTPKELYSLDDLKELLTQTEVMIICSYDVHNPYEICSNEEIIETIEDTVKIEQIVSLIRPLDVYDGAYPAVGAGLVIHALDEKESLLVNLFYYPYVGIEKGDSFYYLDSDSQTLQSMDKILGY